MKKKAVIKKIARTLMIVMLSGFLSVAESNLTDKAVSAMRRVRCGSKQQTPGRSSGRRRGGAQNQGQPPAPEPQPPEPEPQADLTFVPPVELAQETRPLPPAPALIKSADKAERENLQQRINELLQSLASKDEEISRLNGELSSMARGKIDAEEKANDFKVKLSKVVEDLTACQKSVVSLKSELDLKSQENEKLKKTLHELEQRMRDCKFKADEDQKQITSKDELLARLRVEIDIKHRELENSRSESKEQQRQLELQISDLRQALDGYSQLAETKRPGPAPAVSLQSAIIEIGTPVYEGTTDGRIIDRGWDYKTTMKVEVRGCISIDGIDYAIVPGIKETDIRYVKKSDLFVPFVSSISTNPVLEISRLPSFVALLARMNKFLPESKRIKSVLDFDALGEVLCAVVPKTEMDQTTQELTDLTSRLSTANNSLEKQGVSLVNERVSRQQLARNLEATNVALRQLREGRLVELQYMKQRTRSKIEKLRALHQMEIDALVNAFRKDDMGEDPE
ncbi:MAG: hypothetical protein LBF33_01260 [Oscillospiraceae bacterium]|jgi:hypothetical protein|nr:hypothetical protein [Oscillospiraceae bacterium]